jgi:ubiquitin-protein ligase
MTPRDRRLIADLEAMTRLATVQSQRFAFEADGAPPEQYSVAISVTGLARGIDGVPVLRDEHRFDAYLHRDYPRQAPFLTWRTPIFHPNILPPSRNGGVCIGSWSPSEGLADLCERIARLVSYESFSLEDVLDHEAADWVNGNSLVRGVELGELVART